MKMILTQTLLCLLIFLFGWGVIYILQDVIGWSYLYLLIAGYWFFIFSTSRYNWIVTNLQFVIVGFLSFAIIGSLYNEVYEPFIEQNYYQYENNIATIIGILELIIIKHCSDFILSKTQIKAKDSIIDKLLMQTKTKA